MNSTSWQAIPRFTTSWCRRCTYVSWTPIAAFSWPADRPGVFTPKLDDDQLAMTFVALEDAYGLHIVAVNALMTVDWAAAAVRAVASELGCPPSI